MSHHERASDLFKFDVAKVVRPSDATHCLKCGYHNFLGLTQQDIKGKVEATVVPVVDTFLKPLGWQYLGVGVFGNYFDLYYKEASPAVAITTGLLITILVSVTIIILGVCITVIKFLEVEKEKLVTEAKVDKKELLDEGKITSDQYTELVKAQEEEEKGLGDLIKWAIIGFMIFAIFGALGRRRD